jgi:hypothetical protein
VTGKGELGTGNQIMEEKVKKLQKEKSDSERLCNSALEESRITREFKMVFLHQRRVRKEISYTSR